jgi:hypothetical protein
MQDTRQRRRTTALPEPNSMSTTHTLPVVRSTTVVIANKQLAAPRFQSIALRLPHAAHLLQLVVTR